MSKKLLLVDDEPGAGYSLEEIASESGFQLLSARSGEEALKLIPQSRPDLVLMEARLKGLNGIESCRRIRQMDSRVPVILMSESCTGEIAIEAMKIGAYDFVAKPFELSKLKAALEKALAASVEMSRAAVHGKGSSGITPAHPLVGTTEAMQAVFKLIGRVAASDATVLITGESGTGKELTARAVFENSRRANKPFLTVNCAAIPEHLLESELFGHEQGAFTGAASRRIGKFEHCAGGTLFLDEIGDMTMATQTKVLRVIQSGTFERVGSNRTLHSDVRILAATNKDLEVAVAAGQFRRDLFYRLNVVRLHMPPLRDRRDDIPQLVNHFLNKLCIEKSMPAKVIATEAMNILCRYRWPGNVRELENLIERAVVLSKGETILASDFPTEIGRSPRPILAAVESPVAPPMEAPGTADLARNLFVWAKKCAGVGILATVQKELIARALEEEHGNQSRAAALLGITRSTLRSRIKVLGLRENYISLAPAYEAALAHAS